MSADPYCGVCEGAGWDWRRAADEDLQVDDPVDYYECPCVDDAAACPTCHPEAGES